MASDATMPERPQEAIVVNRSRAPLIVGLAVAVVVIALDQWTKALASAQLSYASPVVLTSWFNLTLAHNTGAAFSFLADAGGWQRTFFIAVAVTVCAALVIWLARLRNPVWWQVLALGLVLGGGLGNLWDRAVLGHVVDFISLHYDGWYWPAFNIADSAISVGAVLLVFDSFRAQ